MSIESLTSDVSKLDEAFDTLRHPNNNTAWTSAHNTTTTIKSMLVDLQTESGIDMQKSDSFIIFLDSTDKQIKEIQEELSKQICPLEKQFMNLRKRNPESTLKRNKMLEMLEIVNEILVDLSEMKAQVTAKSEPINQRRQDQKDISEARQAHYKAAPTKSAPTLMKPTRAAPPPPTGSTSIFIQPKPTAKSDPASSGKEYKNRRPVPPTPNQSPLINGSHFTQPAKTKGSPALPPRPLGSHKKTK